MTACVLPGKIRFGFTRRLFAVLILLGLFFVCIRFRALAQSDDDDWTTPVNLSHSGAASSPAVVIGPDGNLRVFWWDQFDGLMVAEGTMELWSEPVPAPIFLVERVEDETAEEEELIFTPVKVIPHIVAGAAGGAHAFWLGEPLEPDAAEKVYEEPGVRPLMHSRLASGSTSWSWAGVVSGSAVSFDVVADPAGALHMVYVRASRTRGFPAGLYYRQSSDGGVSWSPSVAIYESRYFRLLSEDAHVRLATGNSGGVYVTWDDPHLEQALFTHSADGGATWERPEPVGGLDSHSQQGRLAAAPGGEVLLLWEDVRLEEGCSLYQATVSELLTGVMGAGQRVLEDLTTCLKDVRFLSALEAQVLIMAGTESDVLNLAVWDGGQWSGMTQLSFQFLDPELDKQVRLRDLRPVLVSSPSVTENADTLIVVGTDQNDEIWITGSRVGVPELVSAPTASYPTPVMPSEDGVGVESSLPVNLSQSGAASSPAIVTGPDGTLRVFWWDQFDGLMAANGMIMASSVLSGTEEVSKTLEIWSEPAPMPLSAAVTPRIVADAAGRVHAFWLDSVGEGSSTDSLMHSRSIAGGSSWSPPAVLTESAIGFDVAADASGELHLAYLRTLHSSDSPAGLYYRRSSDGGLIWGAPTKVHGSRYFRLLASETAHLHLAIGDLGEVYVTWDDPRLRRTSFARSEDGGITWQMLGPVGDPDGQPQRGRVVAVPGGQVLLLWEDTRFGGRCNLFQVTMSELLVGIESGGRRILEGLTSCPQNERFFPIGAGQALMVSGRGGDVLTLSVWDGGQWSAPRSLTVRFEDPELGEQVYVGDLEAALVQVSPSEEGWARWALMVVGIAQEDDVWVNPSQMGALGVVFAPPAPWSEPVSFSESGGLPGLPAMVADPEGRVHVLWREAEGPGESGTALLYARWDGERWTRSTRVLQSPEGGAAEPALIIVGDRLHALWSGGQNGEILYSRAFLRDAYMAGGWSEPLALPAPVAVGSWPDIAADASGALHVVYVVPLNEERGIYYTHSDDDGESWSPARKVADAVAAGWAMVDYPRLAVDWRGVLHVTWVRATLPGGGAPEGVYYARSTDRGQTWSEPLEVVEGPFTWPQVATKGDQIHLLWNDVTDGRAWWHQWSADGGQAWTRPERVWGFGNVPGPVGLASDGVEMLHLTGLGYDDAGKPALLFLSWDGQRWSEQETFHLDLTCSEPGLASALSPTLGRLDVAFRGVVTGKGEMMQCNLWYTGRVVPTVATTPAPKIVLPSPTATPPPMPTSTVTPSPTPGFVGASPSVAGGSMEVPLPLLLGGGLAVLLVVSVFGTRLLWLSRR